MALLIAIEDSSVLIVLLTDAGPVCVHCGT